MNNPDREAGRIKSKSAGRGNQRLPGASLLDLQERRRELIQCENQPVAVTSPYGLPAIPVEAHGDDGGPGFDTRDFYLGGLPERLAEPPRSCNGWKLASAARFPRRWHVVPQNRAVWALGSVINQKALFRCAIHAGSLHCDRRDQAGVIVLDVADPRANRPAGRSLAYSLAAAISPTLVDLRASVPSRAREAGFLGLPGLVLLPDLELTE